MDVKSFGAEHCLGQGHGEAFLQQFQRLGHEASGVHMLANFLSKVQQQDLKRIVSYF